MGTLSIDADLRRSWFLFGGQRSHRPNFLRSQHLKRTFSRLDTELSLGRNIKLCVWYAAIECENDPSVTPVALWGLQAALG